MKEKKLIFLAVSSLLFRTVLYLILEIGTESTDLLHITRRNEWFAKQPKTQLTRMNLPNQVIIAHTESMDTRVRISVRQSQCYKPFELYS